MIFRKKDCKNRLQSHLNCAIYRLHKASWSTLPAHWLLSGRSSGVEHNLAKVGVGRSNRLARSSFSGNIQIFQPRFAAL